MLKNRRDTHIELRQALHPHPPKKGNDMKHRHLLIPPEKLSERERENIQAKGSLYSIKCFILGMQCIPFLPRLNTLLHATDKVFQWITSLPRPLSN